MKTPRLPKTDSIQELAQFWDEHDLTDFEDELEEVTDPVFKPAPVNLDSEDPDEIQHLGTVGVIRRRDEMRSGEEQAILKFMGGVSHGLLAHEIASCTVTRVEALYRHLGLA